MADSEKSSDGKQNLPSAHGLAGSERPPHPKTKLVEVAGADETVTVTLIVRRRPGGPAMKGPEDSPRNPTVRGHLSRAQFEEARGSTQSDLEAVGQFCRSQHLTVLDANRSRRTVVARGTVAQMNAAFGVTLQHYESPIGKYHGYEGQIQLPVALDGIVEAVLGLDNRPVPARHLSADPPHMKALTPQSVAQLYNFPAGTGAGQTIGIYEMPSEDDSGKIILAGYTTADLSKTMNGFGGGLTVPAPIDVPTGSNGGVSDAETVLDITVASAVAQGAKIAVYFATGAAVSDIVGTLQNMIHPTGTDPVPTIVSISWGWSPDDLTTYISDVEYGQMSQLFLDAANLGVTVLVSSGDAGAQDVPGEPDPTQARTSYPATDPSVLACGGTTIGGIVGSNFDEYVWNDLGATGGGISARFGVPAYQNASNIPKRNITGTLGRGIPDVAGNASPNSGYPIFTGGDSQGAFGGTSAVAPLYAGLIARINQILGENVGFLNPTLYALGAGACRDVTGAAGPTNNTFNGVTGYPAGIGWDACTGLGRIDGSALLSILQRVFQSMELAAILPLLLSDSPRSRDVSYVVPVLF
jgi:kumamolisin